MATLAEYLQNISNAVVPDEAIKTESTVTFPGWGKVVTLTVLGVISITAFIAIAVVLTRKSKAG